jgi:hypothetical protein
MPTKNQPMRWAFWLVILHGSSVLLYFTLSPTQNTQRGWAVGIAAAERRS